MKIRLIPMFLVLAFLFGACADNLNPLSPGSTVGSFANAIKELVPLKVGNAWTYDAVIFDSSSGATKMEYQYSVTVGDTAIADTSLIPLLAGQRDRRSLKPAALTWYLVTGEEGKATYWQVDTLDRFCIRKLTDASFYEQRTFDFSAAVGDSGIYRYARRDTVVWPSGDTLVFPADSVRTSLVSKGVDSLRTTLGSQVYYCYKLSYYLNRNYSLYYFKPGFGILMTLEYRRKPDGTMYLARQDKLTSYSLQ